MSSIHSYKSQVAPFTFYVAGASANYLTIDSNGALTNITAPATAGTVFADMGKTVVTKSVPLALIYRKVQVVTDNNGIRVADGPVGYICLNNNDLGAVNQNINKLN